MKKILAGMAVLAFVAAAQAELLNTWVLSSGSQLSNQAENGENGTHLAANIGKVTFGDLIRPDAMGQGASSGAMMAANNWTANNNLSFTVNVDSEYEIANGVLHASSINGVQSAPDKLQWKLNGTAVGDAWTLSTASGSSTHPDVSFDTITGNNTIALTYSGTGRINSSTAAATSGANVRLYGPMTFSGDIQAASSPSSVPEPATMSLLGLGALAMVIRRKLRK